jgi:hypothetical protein
MGCMGCWGTATDSFSGKGGTDWIFSNTTIYLHLSVVECHIKDVDYCLVNRDGEIYTALALGRGGRNRISTRLFTA